MTLVRCVTALLLATNAFITGAACRGNQPRAVAVSAAESHTAALLSDGTVWTWGQVAVEGRRWMRQPARVAGLYDATAIAASPRTTLVLRKSGRVTRVVHTADVVRLEDVDGIGTAVAIAAGRTAGGALTADGRVHVFCVGSDSCPVADGRPTTLAGIAAASAIALGDDGVLFVRRDGGVAFAPFDGSAAVPVEGLSRVVSIAAGGRDHVAVDADGHAWRWDNRSTTAERLAMPARARRARASERCVYFVLEDGRIMAAGDNRWGQLGRPSSGPIEEPIALASYTGARDVAGGAAHTVVVTRDGEIEAFGGNVEAQLGRAAEERLTRPTRVEGPARIAAVSLGYESSLFLSADGNVWTAGRNPDGQLGAGFWGTAVSPPIVLSSLPPAASVSAGSTHALALLRDGTLRAWGRNEQGSLGDGTREPRLQPVAVVDLHDVVAACAGGDVSYAIARGGGLWRWGAPGRDPDVGDEDDDLRPRRVATTSGFTSVVCNDADRSAVLLHGDGSVWQLSAEPKATPQPLPSLAGIKAVATSDGHSLALDSAGGVWEWRGFETAPVKVIAAGAAAIAAGSHHAAVRYPDGSVWTWGRGAEGALCGGGLSDAEQPVRVADTSAAIAAGYEGTIIVLPDGSAAACGWNQPRLGVGLASSSTPLPIALPGASSP